MSLMRRLQDRPHLLERSYRLSKGVLKVFSRWLQPGGFVEGFFIRALVLGSVCDAINATDASGANVHMSSVAVCALLTQAGYSPVLQVSSGFI